MAHADYDCCAICDSKQSYSSDPLTKEEICSACLKDLRSQGLSILGVDELLEWINSCDKDELRKVLGKIGFRFCYYTNGIDKAVIDRGIEADNTSRLIKEETN